MTITMPQLQPTFSGPGGISLAPHQRQIVDFMVSRSHCGAWLKIGGGKTLSTLAALQVMRPLGHILVIAPVPIARSTWLDEIDKWNFPIRTRSLIVNEHDRKLSRAKRLERFAQVFTDPPTMYFINQELLTQPSQNSTKLVPVPGVGAPGTMGQMAGELLALLTTLAPLARDELIQAYRNHKVATGSAGPPAKGKVSAALGELTRAGLIERRSFPCTSCAGKGCASCCFGLIDQMPVQDINGRPTTIWPFQTVIIDEAQAFKSHTSARFKALAKVTPAIHRMIQLTGTPAPNGLHDLWSQIYLLDQGQALGKNITTFRNRWFDPKMIPGTTTPAKWIPRDGAEAEIHAAISHLVMSAENSSLSLPDLTINDVRITLDPDLMVAYKKFKRDLVLEIASGYLDDAGKMTADITSVVAENQAVLTAKLMQFASGTLYTADADDPSTKGRYEVIHTKKLEMVEYLVRNNNGEPVLLPYHFRSDRTELLAMFKKARIDARAFDGSRAMVADWNAGKIPVMLLHPASAGHGLNLQHGGSTLIWYTLPFSLEHYLQTIGRLHRTGQTRPVMVHRLITKGTHDERMPTLLAGKADVQNDLMNAVSSEQALLAELAAEIEDDLHDLWRTDRI